MFSLESGFIQKRIKHCIRQAVETLLLVSLNRAAKQLSLEPLAKKLQQIYPDLTRIRSNYSVNTPFLKACYRYLDTFQIELSQQALGQSNASTVVDIGDSSGRHLIYLKRLNEHRRLQTLAVNMDPVAVSRIQSKGIRAICERAENLSRHLESVDLALCFQTLEHLSDPCRFLHSLSYDSKIRHLVVTVPYVRRSQVGLHHLRRRKGNYSVNAENTHIFEFSPSDWELIFRHSGWLPEVTRIYRQYPVRHPLFLCRFIWRKYGHEGFLGVVLKREHSDSDRYMSW